LSANIDLGGSGTAATSVRFATVQPTMTANCMIRVLSRLKALPASTLATNHNAPDMLAIVDRRRTAA